MPRTAGLCGGVTAPRSEFLLQRFQQLVPIRRPGVPRPLQATQLETAG